MMMEPSPVNRPSIDEVLMHPRLQTIQATIAGPKRNLKFDCMNSPIVEKLRNPLSTRNDHNREMILISPRILKSA